jgi:hypothetical protein
MASPRLLETTFACYEMDLAEVVEYTSAVMPYIVEKPTSLRVFMNGSIVLSVAHLEDFLRSLVGTAGHLREGALRTYLAQYGNDADKDRVKTCDLIPLVRMAKSSLSFKKGGVPISRIFDAVFHCSPWPSDAVRDVILDLVFVRNMIVHSGSAEVGVGGVGAHAKQFRRADVFTIRSYGEFTTYRIDPLRTLRFYHQALMALKSQVDHLRVQIVKSDGWLHSP